jgi:hypothetical protein
MNLIRLLAALSLWTVSALAGPNAGAVLAIHGTADPGETCDDLTLPLECQDLIPDLPGSGEVTFFVVLALPGPDIPEVSAVVFGLGDFDPSAIEFTEWGPCNTDLNPLEISTAGWPGPGEGTAMSWSPGCLEDYLIRVYYFPRTPGHSFG